MKSGFLIFMCFLLIFPVSAELTDNASFTFTIKTCKYQNQEGESHILRIEGLDTNGNFQSMDIQEGTSGKITIVQASDYIPTLDLHQADFIRSDWQLITLRFTNNNSILKIENDKTSIIVLDGIDNGGFIVDLAMITYSMDQLEQSNKNITRIQSSTTIGFTLTYPYLDKDINGTETIHVEFYQNSGMIADYELQRSTFKQSIHIHVTITPNRLNVRIPYPISLLPIIVIFLSQLRKRVVHRS